MHIVYLCIIQLFPTFSVHVSFCYLRCELRYLDGVSIFRLLRELHLTHNHLTDLEPLTTCPSSVLALLELDRFVFLIIFLIAHLGTCKWRWIYSQFVSNVVLNYKSYDFALFVH